MTVLPPGTLLQLIYLRERLRSITPGRFIEVGPGSGEVTRLLLDCGWSGSSYDLEAKTTTALKIRFAKEISDQRYSVINADYTASNVMPDKADLVISCMVMEHLEDDQQTQFMHKSAAALQSTGLLIGLVPASPAHWGIEDDIAGHCRRYTRTSVQTLLAGNNWELQHIAGLTYPVSNMLLPISNFLVNRNERSKLALSALERTKSSGRRHVGFKTHFPPFLGLLLNMRTLYPLHWIQKQFSRSKSALVLYFEAKNQPDGGTT